MRDNQPTRSLPLLQIVLVLAMAGFLSVSPSCSSKPFVNLADGGDGGSTDDASDDDPFRPSCPGQETTLRGRVLAPNATDPVPGATVFVPASVPELFPPQVECEVCANSLGAANTLWSTTTKYDGSFTLTGICPGPRAIVFQNGRFRRVVQIDVPAATVLDVPPTHSRLPAKNGENHPADAIPRIAVATGDFDKMECVLRKMGLADGAYDLYQGSTSLAPPVPLPQFSTLVNSLEKMKGYNIIFINCTRNTFEHELKKPEVRQKLEAYVQAGGRLYVTDWSYDWIEQLLTLAPFIDFEPGPSSTDPEPFDQAALGAGGLMLDATVKDPRLAQWLSLFPGAINGDKVHIEHFLEGWVMMHALHEGTKTWVEGTVQTELGILPVINDVRPLTVTFNYENCGKILFSSYHTEGRKNELPQNFPDYCRPEFSPQDRILEYLIFDIANCIAPIK